MARKSPDSNGASTATADAPKTRKRKSPKDRAESLTVRAMNAIDSLGCMAEKLTEAQREAVTTAIQNKLNETMKAFEVVGEESEPEVFALPD